VDRIRGLATAFGILASVAGAGAARAGDDAAPPAAAPSAVDAGAPEPAAPPSEGAPPSDTGPGLFEQGLAAGSGEAKSAPAAAAAPPFLLDGYVRGDMFVGKTPDAPRGQLKADYGELALAVRTKKEPYGDAFAEARIRYGLQGEEQQAFLDLREAYVNAYLGPFDLRLGQQIIVWGRADALNPTNNLTPVDFRIRSPLEDDIRLGNVGARAFFKFAPFRLEGVWMPVYLPTVLPPVELPQYVSFGPPTYPAPDLSNGTEAARLHLELPSFEMSVSYLHGYALLPGITLTGVTLTAVEDPITGNVTPGPTPPSILVSRTAYSQQVIGFDFSTALGDLMTIRGEAAYRRPYDYRNAQYGQVAFPDVQYVLGADHNFGPVSLIVQYMGRYVFDWQKQNGPAAPLDPALLLTKTMANDEGAVRSDVTAQLQKTNQILFSQTAQLQHLATVRFEWTALHDTLSISSLCMFNFTTKEWLVTPRIGYRLSDAITAYVGAQIFMGPDDTLFGLIDQELSAGYAEMRFIF
jgi:hypothetical protein